MTAPGDGSDHGGERRWENIPSHAAERVGRGGGAGGVIGADLCQTIRATYDGLKGTVSSNLWVAFSNIFHFFFKKKKKKGKKKTLI